MMSHFTLDTKEVFSADISNKYKCKKLSVMGRWVSGVSEDIPAKGKSYCKS